MWWNMDPTNRWWITQGQTICSSMDTKRKLLTKTSFWLLLKTDNHLDIISHELHENSILIYLQAKMLPIVFWRPFIIIINRNLLNLIFLPIHKENSNANVNNQQEPNRKHNQLDNYILAVRRPTIKHCQFQNRITRMIEKAQMFQYSNHIVGARILFLNFHFTMLNEYMQSKHLG